MENYDYNWKIKAINFLEASIGKKGKVVTIKEDINKLGFLKKFKSSVSQRRSSRKWNGKPRVKIFIMHVTDKALKSKTYKELIQCNNKITQFFKMASEVNQCYKRHNTNGQ